MRPTRPLRTPEEDTTLVDTSNRRPWVAEAEAILRQLREIEHAAIATDGDEIREVHVVARTARRVSGSGAAGLKLFPRDVAAVPEPANREPANRDCGAEPRDRRSV